MMDQKPFPEETKKREEGRQAPEPKKREEGREEARRETSTETKEKRIKRQAPEPRPDPGGTSKS